MPFWMYWTTGFALIILVVKQNRAHGGIAAGHHKHELKLKNACYGDMNRYERLLRHETDMEPGITRQEAARRACERFEHENK